MELRAPAKIAITIVTALGTIGGLHFLIFKDRAAEYATARGQFESSKAQYASQGTAPDINDIHLFRYITLKYDLMYWEKLKNLRITLPESYGVGLANLTQELREREVWDILRGLEERRERAEAGEGTQLPFLGENGWNIRTTLPRLFVEGGVAPEDRMTNLRNEESLLRNLNPGTTVYQTRRNTYRRIMSDLGVNPDNRETLQTRFGDLSATLLTLNRIDLILNNLPDDYFTGFDENRPGEELNEEEQLRIMYRLFQIPWPRAADGSDAPDLGTARRQGEGLLQIIDAASDAGVDEIRAVRAHRFREIRWKDREAEADEPEPDPQDMFDSDMMMWEEMMMMGGVGMGMDGMGMGGMGMGMGMGARQTQEEQEPPTAFGAPVEVLAVGSNSAIMNWLFRLSKDQNPIELDRLVLRVGQDGRLNATAYFNVVTAALYLGIMTTGEIDQKIVETKRELANLALTRPSVRPVAEEDGLIRIEGTEAILVEPTPTPWEGDEAPPQQEQQPSPDQQMLDEMGFPGMIDGM